jgi:hypothetical protein
MPCVGFEPTFPVFESAKTFHVLARATTVTVGDAICRRTIMDHFPGPHFSMEIFIGERDVE